MRTEPGTTLHTAYDALIASNGLERDSAQLDAVRLLSEITTALETSQRSPRLTGIFGTKPEIRGAYIWGEVGRGKTMLMDLFFSTIAVEKKRRLHFHEFMDEVHTAIAAFRAETGKSPKGRRDPIPVVTKPIIAETRLLCLDEFRVNDITNAMLLGRLFDSLFAGGVVLVTTSNIAPDALYADGLNRQLFLPFIDLLKRKTEVFELAATTDYRRLKLAGQKVFAFGPPAKTRKSLDGIWNRLTGGQLATPATLHSLGRTIPVPRQAMGYARFTFADLCQTPLGARDYLRLAHAYDGLVIDDVPRLDRAPADATQRFILLIDTLYDRGAKLAAGFAVPLDELGRNVHASAFARCRSRLAEMQSDAYLSAPHKQAAE